MVRRKGAAYLMDAILKNEKLLLTSVFKPYENQGYSLEEGFEKLAACLAVERADVAARKKLEAKHEKRFQELAAAAHLIERGYVQGHENYEYEWYLQLDETPKKKERVALFINRVYILETSLALIPEPAEAVAPINQEAYQRSLQQIIDDADERLQSIRAGEKSPTKGVLNHQYVSDLYGEVSTKELIQYATQATVTGDEFVLLALDQKIDAVMKVLAGNNQAKEMDILLGLGYLLDLYDFDFERTQTSRLEYSAVCFEKGSCE